MDRPHLRDKEKSVSIQNLNLQTLKRSHPKVFCEKVSVEILQNSQENIFAGDSFLIKKDLRPATLLKKTVVQMFSQFFKSTYFHGHL